ncbi:hypothetical protein ACFY12_28465 [Streptomyces sp. NPDC001339]|uniref:hypothetical protein n=1 Tax=Streptomyces sp. NPDC001339 TaxID=3364563 RepID=UPI0036C6D130
MSGYHERPVSLGEPFNDLAPEPVPDCDRCAALAEERCEARKEGQFGAAVIASIKIREHRMFGSHD